jgi:hypothetical protein
MIAAPPSVLDSRLIQIKALAAPLAHLAAAEPGTVAPG